MNKLILFSIVFGSYVFGDIHSDADFSSNQSNATKYSLVQDCTDDLTTDANRRSRKGQRGRRKGGYLLR